MSRGGPRPPKPEPWSWLKAVEVAERHGELRISWHWRNRQKVSAARRAVKKGKLKQVRGKPGAYYFVPLTPMDQQVK